MPYKVRPAKICQLCGQKFTPTNHYQKSCGRDCPSRPEPKRVSSRVFFGQCSECNKWFCARNSRGRYCSKECRDSEMKRRARIKWNLGYKDSDVAKRRAEKARQERIAAWVPYVCQSCGAESVGFSGRLYCSKECARSFVKKRDRKRAGRYYHQKRAKMYGVDYEPGITIEKLAERDDDICGLCGEAVVAEWPDLMAGSIDHVTPMSAGGSHTWANVQLAHFLCNSYKGADPDVDFRLEDESCQQLPSSTRPVATAA